MASLDTNCLLRWLLGDLQDQKDRVEALLATGHRFVVEDVVIVETVFVLETRGKMSRATIHECLTTIMAYPMTLNRDLWTAVLSLWVGHPKLSVVDVYLAVKAEQADEQPVYTFDVKMANQLSGVALVPTLDS